MSTNYYIKGIIKSAVTFANGKKISDYCADVYATLRVHSVNRILQIHQTYLKCRLHSPTTVALALNVVCFPLLVQHTYL